MKPKLNLKLNDLVVRYGKVLKVSKIKSSTVDFKPLFDFPGSNDLTFTLNIDNIKNDHMRQLVSKVKIKNLFKSIIKTPLKDTKPPKFDSKTALLANKLEDTFWIIKTLWLEKQANEDALPSGKLTIFKKAMLQASNELAAVNKILPSKAKSQILAGLNFSQK